MAYEFNRKMVLEPKNSTTNFEEVQNLIRELVEFLLMHIILPKLPYLLVQVCLLKVA